MPFVIGVLGPPHRPRHKKMHEITPQWTVRAPGREGFNARQYTGGTGGRQGRPFCLRPSRRTGTNSFPYTAHPGFDILPWSEAHESSETMRVLQVYPKDDYFTGAAVQLRELARGLVCRGHRVVVVTRPSEIWAERCREAGVVYCGVPMRHEVDLPSIRQLARVIREHKIEVVHVHKGLAHSLMMVVSPIVPAPALVVNRGVSFPLTFWNGFKYRSRRVSKIVAVCESIKRALVVSGRISPEKIEVIYSGVDTERFHPGVDGSGVRRELGLRPDDFVITQIGVRSWKGNDHVLEALAAIRRMHSRAVLLFVGCKPHKITELGGKARALGLGNAVLCLGFRTDIPQVLAASNCSVDASYAGLGLAGAVRESLAVGTPVVATNLEGNPEIVIDGVTGLLVPPRDPEAIARAITVLMANQDRAREMGRAGRALVEERFSARVKLDRMEALYRGLLAERGRAAA